MLFLTSQRLVVLPRRLTQIVMTNEKVAASEFYALFVVEVKRPVRFLALLAEVTFVYVYGYIEYST